MSKAVSALLGAKYQGYVDVAEAGLRGMITVRGDLKSAGIATAVLKVTGCDLPGPGGVNLKAKRGVAWMSPDELLVLGPYASVEKDAQTLSGALKGAHHLVVNVSDARAVFTLSGADAREVLAKLSPADMSGSGFTKGQMRRSRLAQVPAAFWISGKDKIDVVCFRSVGGYVFGLLANAAKPGSQVGSTI